MGDGPEGRRTRPKYCLTREDNITCGEGRAATSLNADRSREGLASAEHG